MIPRMPKEEKIKLIEKSELKFIEGNLKNFDSKFIVECKCGNKFETTLRTIKNSNYKLKCKECRSEIARNKQG
jgi:translation initiation factor 2 beta subunit (eIF-2beta)/eIF-5